VPLYQINLSDRDIKNCLKKSDINKDGTIDKSEFQEMCIELGKKYPALLDMRSRADTIFAKADTDGSNALTLDEFTYALETLDKSLTRFPTSASTAVQQGQFLAKLFNTEGDVEESTEKAFRYKHFGGYEYVGAEDGLVKRGSKGGFIFSGPGAMWLWYSVLFSRVVSLQLKLGVISNQIWTAIFGRASTRI